MTTRLPDAATPRDRAKADARARKGLATSTEAYRQLRADGESIGLIVEALKASGVDLAEMLNRSPQPQCVADPNLDPADPS